jgi:arabinogalactan endo-1,4-beta-galactosidase
MRKMGQLLLLVMLVHFISCHKNEPRISDDPNAVKIINSGFETGGSSQSPSGWSTIADGNNQDADFTQSGGKKGSFCLTHSKNSAYKVYTYQELAGLDTGYYSLTVWVTNGGGQNSCYLTAKDYGDVERMTSLPVTNVWTQVIIRGIHVTNGKCIIGFYSDALAGNWCKMDDVKMLKEGQPYQFLKGGDLSELSYIESMGGKF